MPKLERVGLMLGADYLALGEDGDGPYVAAIRAAAAVFLARFPRADLAEYKIAVCREGEQFHVIFLDKERPEGARGSGGRTGCPGFAVTMRSADLSVLDGHFIR
jgi:hypothetical protein